MELRTVITKYVYCKTSLVFCYVLLTIIGSGSTYSSDILIFENNQYNKVQNQQYLIELLSTNINIGNEKSNIYLYNKRQVGSQTGSRKVHWAPVATSPDKTNSKEETIEKARIWGSQPLDISSTPTLTNGEGGIKIEPRFNFQTYPRPTKKKNRIVFQLRERRNK